jgi:hypothetical protein
MARNASTESMKSLVMPGRERTCAGVRMMREDRNVESGATGPRSGMVI